MGTTHLDQLQVAGVPTMGVNPLPLANNYWFVSSLIGSNSFQGNQYTTPFGTLAYALTQSSLAVGDCIVVMEGHAETVTAAGGLTAATVGIYVIGLGNGAYRPTFTFATPATTSFLISAASVTIANIVGLGSVNTLTKPFDIQAASCTLGSAQYGWVEWQDPSSSLQAQRVVLTNASADKLTVNLKVIGITSGGTAPVHVVQMIGVDSAILNLDCYGRASTATVNFTDTASTNVEIYGYIYNASNSAASYAKDIVDTVSGTTWWASVSDGFVGFDLSGGSGTALGPAQAATVIADLAVATADGTANAYERDVIGNKTDVSVQAISATASLAGYVKGLTDAVAGTAGLATFPAAAVAANAVSLAEVIRYIQEVSTDRVATSATAAMVDGATIFTVSGGPIQIISLVSECITTNDTTASTVQYAATATGLAQQTISNASASVASAALHATVSLIGTALSTAAVYNAKGVNLGMSPPGGVVMPVGVIQIIIGVGSTTGTWRHIIRYRPLVAGAAAA